MKLLVSCQDEGEALAALAGGAAIIDVKNPREEVMGANVPRAIRAVRAAAPHAILSVTLGALPNLPGTAALAALGAAVAGADYIKGGLLNVRDLEEAVTLMGEVRRAVEDLPVKVIAAGYADYKLWDGLDPRWLPEIATRVGADGVLVDTRIKDQGNLFDYMDQRDIADLVVEAHARGLSVALSGQLREEDLHRVQAMGADIIGVRGAVCTRGDRYTGRVEEEAVRSVMDCLTALRVA